MIRRPPRSPLFPYPTLFRSGPAAGPCPQRRRVDAQGRCRRRVPDLERAGSGLRVRRDAFQRAGGGGGARQPDRKSTRLNSSHSEISYAVFCLKKKTNLSRRLRSPSPIRHATGKSREPADKDVCPTGTEFMGSSHDFPTAHREPLTRPPATLSPIRGAGRGGGGGRRGGGRGPGVVLGVVARGFLSPGVHGAPAI